MFIDFHNDVVLKLVYDKCDFIAGDENLCIDLPKIRACKGLAGLFFAACCDPVFKGEEAVKNAMRLLGVIKNALSRCGDRIKLVSTKEDVSRAMSGGKVAAILAIEGGYAINDSLADLEMFYSEGVRLMTLTHSKSTSWAGSAHDAANTGLTPLGVDIVKKMNELGMIIDLAHVSDNSIFDAARVSKMPIVCSHGSARGAYNGFRSLSDDVIRAIAGTGGVIGIIFFPDFLVNNPNVDKKMVADLFARITAIENDPHLASEDKVRRAIRLYFGGLPKPKNIPGVEAVLRHMDYIIDLVGDDHVAIGSDYDGAPYFCKGLEDISKLGNLANAMAEHGYSKERVDKIMGGNILRIVRGTLNEKR